MSTGIRDAYNKHRLRARRTGIAMVFTFDEWVDWWLEQLGPAWMHKRGSKKHQYCMARHKDKGPYARGNVKCITNAENRAEQIAPCQGERSWWAKLTKEQVLAIRCSKDTRQHLAQKFGVLASYGQFKIKKMSE